MVILLIIISTLLLFSKSRYFPKEWQSASFSTKKRKGITRMIACLLQILALVLCIQFWDGFTGLIVWLILLILSFSTIIMLVPTIDWFPRWKR